MLADDFREQKKGKPPAMAIIIKKLAERVRAEAKFRMIPLFAHMYF